MFTHNLDVFFFLVPNCPGAKLSGAKLSVFVRLVPNCPGAKFSGAKLSGAKLSGAKLSYNPSTSHTCGFASAL